MAALHPPLPTRWWLLPSGMLVMAFAASLAWFASRDSAEWAGLVDGILALAHLVGLVLVGVPLGLALRFGRWAQWLLAGAAALVTLPLIKVSAQPHELRSLLPLFLVEAALAGVSCVGAVVRARRG